MKRIDILIYIILFIQCYQISWDSNCLWDITYKNFSSSNNSWNYYLIDPDNLLTKEEYLATKNQLNNFYDKNLVHIYVFFIANIKFNSNSTKVNYLKGLVEDLTQNIQRILFDTFKDHESILIILISKNDKIITFKLGATTASKISNNTVQKITKNSKTYLEYDNRKLLYNVISDFNSFIDKEYDFMDREKIDDYENPFDFEDEDKDEEIDPWDQKPLGPVTPYKPKEEKKDEDKDNNKDKDNNDNNKDKDNNDKENNQNKDDNIVKKDGEKSNFYLIFFIILILIILCFAVLFYFLGKKMKILKIKTINYERLIGTELEQA